MKNIEEAYALLPDQEAIDRGHSALAAADAFGQSFENNLFNTISNKEIVDHAFVEIHKLLEKEQLRKADLTAEGKPSPISDNYIARYTEQLSELSNAEANDIQGFKSISEIRLLYHAVHALEDILYTETNNAAFSPDDIKVFKQQRDELNTRIIEIEKFTEKELDNMSKYDISARVNPLNDQSGKVKAMASVTIDNAVAINNLTVVEGSNGHFVGYPQSKDKEGNFRDIVEFLKDENGKVTQESADLKATINKLLVDMHKNGERQHDSQLKEPVSHNIKAFVTPLRESQNATKGLATVQVGELFKINSVRVNENSKTGENFVAMPSRTDKSSETGYRDVVHPVNKEFAEKLRGAVLKQYDSQVQWKTNMANKEQTQTTQRDTPVSNKSNPDLG